mgnify:CR=1 FL=1
MTTQNDSKKQVLIVSGVYPPEPYVSAKMSEAIAQELSHTNNVTVLCPPVSRPIGKVSPRMINPHAKFNVITLPSYTCPESKVIGRLRESYSFGQHVAEYIRANSDFIKVIYANTHPTFGQYLLLAEAKKYSIPVIIHIQDIYPESITKKIGKIGRIIQPLLAKYDEMMMKKATGIITISVGMKKSLVHSRNFKNDFVEVVYNWQDESCFQSHYPQKKGNKFTFMFVGSLNPTASLNTVIDAFGKANLKDAQLVLAGDGSDKQRCIDQSKKYPNASIIFKSVMPHEVHALQAQADVLLLPLKAGISLTALPSKLPAYMFSAKPIIACVENESDVASIITTTGCGWITEPENTMMLSELMKKCIDIPADTITSKGLAARSYSLTNFSKDINLKKICKIITSISQQS